MGLWGYGVMGLWGYEVMGLYGIKLFLTSSLSHLPFAFDSQIY